MGKAPSSNVKKEAPKFRMVKYVTYYIKDNGHWGQRITEVKEATGK